MKIIKNFIGRWLQYKCKVCGYQSENRKEVEKCKARGVKHKFSAKQRVMFLLEPKGIKRWTKGRIEGIWFRKKTHKPMYRIVLLEKVKIGRETPLLVTVDQRHVRHIS